MENAVGHSWCVMGAQVAQGAGVLFDEHTDSSFVTIALCSLVPGLQIQATDTGEWCLPEQNRDSLDVIVFVGEFMQVLTKSAFKAAVHRVLRPDSNSSDRYSFPFLLRGKHEAVLNTTQSAVQHPYVCSGGRQGTGFGGTTECGAVMWLPEEGEKPMEVEATITSAAVAGFPLLELDGMTVRELHGFMELRRRKQVHESREEHRRELAAKAAGGAAADEKGGNRATVSDVPQGKSAPQVDDGRGKGTGSGGDALVISLVLAAALVVGLGLYLRQKPGGR